MGLLQDIQADAVDSGRPVGDLLRKCKILAARLQYEPLAEWVDHELNGYGDSDALPSYRGPFPADVLGNFLGIGWSQAKGMPIARASVDEEDRDLLFTVKFSQGVAHFESLLASGSGEGGSFSVPWTGDAVAKYQSSLVEGPMSLTSARIVMSRAQITEFIDQIRNRVLTFALEIEGENPDAGESPPGADPPPVASAKIEQLYITNVLGGQNVVASGSDNIISDFEQVTQGDWGALDKALEAFGVTPAEREDLLAAIGDDGELAGDDPGPAVQRWLGAMSAAGARGTTKLAPGVTSSMIATVVMQHLGLA